MFQRVLLAWDGTHVALRAFDVAIGMTRRLDADLLVVSVAASPAHAETREDRDESSQAARQYLEATFANVSDRAERAGVEVEHRVVDSDHPTTALLDYAHEEGADLIICGHHRKRRAGRLLLRGVASELLERSIVPVLVVGAHDD